MSGPIVLREHLFAGYVDGETIAAHLAEAETHLASVREALHEEGGKDLFNRFLGLLETRTADVVAAMKAQPQATATLFALLPSYEMFAVFAEAESIDEHLLAETIRHAPETLRDVATERFEFLGAMNRLCDLLALCRRPSTIASSPSL